MDVRILHLPDNRICWLNLSHLCAHIRLVFFDVSLGRRGIIRRLDFVEKVSGNMLGWCGARVGCDREESLATVVWDCSMGR